MISLPRLRTLLNDENRQWTVAAHRSRQDFENEWEETQFKSMRERLSHLRERREKERQAIVEQKMNQRWRAECEELRTFESKQLVRMIAEDRKTQVVERKMSAMAIQQGIIHDLLCNELTALLKYFMNGLSVNKINGDITVSIQNAIKSLP
jgi:hypothetical protein